MHDNDIKKAFAHITEGAGTAWTENIVLPRTKTRPVYRFPVRCIVPAAVCVGLLLAVSAGAYSVVRHFVIETPDDGPYDYIISLRDELTQMDPVTLSGEITEALADYKEEKSNLSLNGNYTEFGISFASWQAAADWLDCGMLSSQVLGDVPEDMQNAFVGGAALFARYDKNGVLEHILVEANGTVSPADLFCTVRVTVPLAWEPEEYSTRAALTGSPVLGENGILTTGKAHSPDTTDTLSCTTAGGYPLEIVVTEADGCYIVSGFLADGGMIYQFDTSDADRETAVAAVRTIADSLS